MAKVTKGRNWAFLFYPESAPENWPDIIKQSGLKCAISPLHDKDVHSDPMCEDGKKPHWHGIVCWAGPVTFSQAAGFTQGKLNGTIPVKLESVKGYYRYFTHKDDPDKFQYDPAEIQHVGGFDMLDHTDMTFGEKMKLIGEVQDFIEENDIREYWQLTMELRKTDGMRDQWIVAMNNTVLFNAYITSRRNVIAEAEAKQKEASG